MVHRHEFGKEGDTGSLRRGTLVVCLVESPELLGIVPSEEVRILLEEIFKGLEVVILYVGVTSRCRLASEPKSVCLADRGPRLVGLDSVLWHFINILLRVVLARE